MFRGASPFPLDVSLTEPPPRGSRLREFLSNEREREREKKREERKEGRKEGREKNRAAEELKLKFIERCSSVKWNEIKG